MMNRPKLFTLLTIAAMGVAGVFSLSGCELIADFDRSMIDAAVPAVDTGAAEASAQDAAEDAGADAPSDSTPDTIPDTTPDLADSPSDSPADVVQDTSPDVVTLEDASDSAAQPTDSGLDAAADGD